MCKKRAVILPTKDHLIKAKLRELGEPITLFGEDPPDRRNRLREFLAKHGVTAGLPTTATAAEQAAIAKAEAEADKEDEEAQELFYTEGTPELRAARRFIASYSIPRAKERIRNQRRLREEEDELERQNASATSTTTSLTASSTTVPTASTSAFVAYLEAQSQQLDKVKKYESATSEIGDDRPLSCAVLSPNSSLLLTSSWSGVVTCWNPNDQTKNNLYKGHEDRVSSVAWHPQACLSQMSSALNFASAGASKNILLWSLDNHEAPIGKLAGHLERVNRVAFHPSGHYLGSTSWDYTWRLWDVETQRQLLMQEGHSRPVYALAFQGDGSLAVTGGLDGIGRVWDLRTGKSIVVLQGHIKEVIATDFHPNGYQIATGSEDNTIRIWDLRKKKSVYTMPAHNNIISSLKFQPVGGNFLVSGCFDNSIKVWSTKDWSLLNTLIAHEGKVTSVDVAHDSSFFVSSSFDRTWKIWK